MALVIDLHAGRDKDRQPSLDLLTALVADDLARVNELVLNKMESQVALIPELAGHIIAAGGKRLRPMLVLGAARLCGYDGERHIGLAACVEFIHTATLLHDDVVDESDLRRGLATANTVWGNKASVLVGDFLLSRSFQLMVIDGSIEVLTILSDASAVIAEGEVMQLITANDTETSETAYLEVIKSKTARLFSAACQLGAVLASRPAIEEEALTSFGLNLGIAFQLVDDVLDYSAPQAALGKAVGDDFREGKITLPIILAFRRGNDGERGFWRHALEKLEQEDGDLERAAALLHKHGALADTMERARHYAKLARDALDIFAAGEAKSALLEAVDFSIERSH